MSTNEIINNIITNKEDYIKDWRFCHCSERVPARIIVDDDEDIPIAPPPLRKTSYCNGCGRPYPMFSAPEMIDFSRFVSI